MKLHCKNIFLAFTILAFFSTQTSYAQVTFTSVVDSPNITLYATDSAAGVATSAYIYLDDIYSDTVNIGFNFTFYGISYSQCVIGANGQIVFDLSLANTFDDWLIDTNLLGNSELLNNICGPFCDMDIVYGGQISYFTTGAAPNRQFVVSYCHDAMYTSAICPGDYTTTQIIIYESSNIIEVHTAHNSACTAWNGGYAITGIQNATGTAATVAPGRDYPSVWMAANESWRFTPDSTGDSYSVDSIAFAPLPYYAVYWFDSSTGAFLGTGDSIVLTPTVPTSYVAYALTCADSITSATDSSGLDTAGFGRVELSPPHPSTTGINQLPLIQDVTVYPNPAHGTLNISADAIINNVTITDLLGETITSQQYNTKQVSINIASLPPGIYLVRLNGAVMSKFVKE